MARAAQHEHDQARAILPLVAAARAERPSDGAGDGLLPVAALNACKGAAAMDGPRADDLRAWRGGGSSPAPAAVARGPPVWNGSAASPSVPSSPST